MKTMKWLLQREFWEHKGSMFWVPIMVGATMSILFGSLIAIAIIGGRRAVMNNDKFGSIVSFLYDLPHERHLDMIDKFAHGYISLSTPLFLMFAVIAFMYCLGSLYDERRDRSILFWKSLPVSDAQTVLSKVLAITCVGPLITIAVAFVAATLMLFMGGLVLSFYGFNLLGPMLSNPRFYLTPLMLIALLPVYILWALPTIGWLMMVSAWAKSKPFLWAVGTPVMALILVKWIGLLFGLLGGSLNLDWFTRNVIVRGLGGLVPGIWFWLGKLDGSQSGQTRNLVDVVTQAWATLGAPSVWIGALAGAAMLVAAIRLRRWKDEG